MKGTNKPECHLIGTDGNVFNVIGNVSSTLKEAGLIDEAKDFEEKALSSCDYDEVLRLCSRYVKIVLEEMEI